MINLDEIEKDMYCLEFGGLSVIFDSYRPQDMYIAFFVDKKRIGQISKKHLNVEEKLNNLKVPVMEFPEKT